MVAINKERMQQLCVRLNEWCGDPRVRFEYERTRIVVRVNGTLSGLLFLRNNGPHLHLLENHDITSGIFYYVDRVISASWNQMKLQRANKS